MAVTPEGKVATAVAKRAVVKREVKKEVNKAKHRANTPVRTVKVSDDVKGFVKDKSKKVAKSSKARFQKQASFIPAKPSYSVRHYHNLLIAMWFTATMILVGTFVVNGEENIASFWKRFWALQFTFFVLSLLVMIDVITKVVSYLSVLIVLALLFTNGQALANVIDKFGKTGMQTPKIQNMDSGATHGIQKANPVDDTTPIIPRSNDIITT